MAQNGRRLPALDNSRQFNPNPIGPVMEHDSSIVTEPWIHDEHKVGRRMVDVSDIIATQDFYNADKVQSMAKNKRLKGVPKAVEHQDGKLYLHDGHHRVIKDKLAGKAKVQVELYRA
jgi:hypothetical protein